MKTLNNKNIKTIINILEQQHRRGGTESAEAEQVLTHLLNEDFQLVNLILEIWDLRSEIEEYHEKAEYADHENEQYKYELKEKQASKALNNLTAKLPSCLD